MKKIELTREQLLINPNLKGSSKRRAILMKVSKLMSEIFPEGHRLPNGKLNPDWYNANTFLFNQVTKINL